MWSKFSKGTVLAALCFCSVLGADLADERMAKLENKCKEHIVDGKFYVEPGSVYVGKEKILLNVEGQFFEVDGIARDEKGIYITKDYVVGYCVYHGHYPDIYPSCLKCAIEGR